MKSMKIRSDISWYTYDNNMVIRNGYWHDRNDVLICKFSSFLKKMSLNLETDPLLVFEKSWMLTTWELFRQTNKNIIYIEDIHKNSYSRPFHHFQLSCYWICPTTGLGILIMQMFDFKMWDISYHQIIIHRRFKFQNSKSSNLLAYCIIVIILAYDNNASMI